MTDPIYFEFISRLCLRFCFEVDCATLVFYFDITVAFCFHHLNFDFEEIHSSDFYMLKPAGFVIICLLVESL